MASVRLVSKTGKMVWFYPKTIFFLGLINGLRNVTTFVRNGKSMKKNVLWSAEKNIGEYVANMCLAIDTYKTSYNNDCKDVENVLQSSVHFANVINVARMNFCRDVIFLYVAFTTYQ